MFRTLYDALTSSSSSSSAAAAAATTAPRKSLQETTKQPNEDRLKNIGYKHEYPRLFEDPITNTIMDNPVILNNCQAQTIDKCTLVQCRQETNSNCFVNPFNRQTDLNGILEARSKTEAADLITRKRAVYIEHTELKNQIDQFIVNLEELHYLTNQVEKLLCPIDDLTSLFQNAGALLVDALIETQKLERVAAIRRNKSEVIELLMEYIRITEAAIDMHADTPDKKKKYKEALLSGPWYLQNLLIAELEQLAKLTPKEQYQFAIEKIDYYHDLIFIPMTDSLRATVTDRIARISDPSAALELAQAVVNESLRDLSGINLMADQSDDRPIAAPAAAIPGTNMTVAVAVAVPSTLFTLSVARAFGLFSYSNPSHFLRAHEANLVQLPQNNSDNASTVRRPPSPRNQLGEEVD